MGLWSKVGLTRFKIKVSAGPQSFCQALGRPWREICFLAHLGCRQIPVLSGGRTGHRFLSVVVTWGPLLASRGDSVGRWSPSISRALTRVESPLGLTQPGGSPHCKEFPNSAPCRHL